MEQGTEARREWVRLADVEPSRDNPRKDMGDIAALAKRIGVTQGQPVNPIVVVRDGGRFRIVDGERRYRALLRLHGEDGGTWAIVYDDYTEAHAAVAMLATDDKKPLTDVEQARGFQEMLRLDVDVAVAARALGRSREDCAKARRVAAEAPAQATLDQMIAASEFEGKDRAAILEADVDGWPAKRESIRRRIARDEMRAGFEEAIAEVGATVLKGEEKGWGTIVTAYSPDELRRHAVAQADGELAVWPCTWDSAKWVLARRVHDEPAHEETEEERAARELEERRSFATDELVANLAAWLAKREAAPSVQVEVGRMREERETYYCQQLRNEVADGEEVSDEDFSKNVALGPASMFECLRAWLYPGAVRRDALIMAILPEACDDGFQTSEEDEWLYGQISAERAARKAGEGK